ncbi:MAG: hypothetical protein HYX76_05445 [Acidobacteria bacterium]|nr:hypothetical protein [Acidobacteriota bacterium]
MLEWRLGAPAMGSTSYMSLLAASGVAYAIAVRELHRRAGGPRIALIGCLILAAAWRAPFVSRPAGKNDDVYRYLWDARLQRHGLNPYLITPSDPKYDWLHTPQTRGINNPDVPTPYPPGAQLFFRVVTSVHESVPAFRLALTICDALVALLLWRWLASVGLSPWWTLAYAWHPLVTIEGAANGHLDLAGIACLMASIVALTRRRGTLAAVFFVLAVTIKLLPIVLAPIYWRRIRLRDGLVAAAVVVALYAPYLTLAGPPIGSLGAFVARFRFNDPVFASLEAWLSPRAAAAVAMMIGVTVAAILRARDQTGAAAWAWPAAATLACAPVIYPWYLLWVTPFLATRATIPLLVWTLSVLSTYRVWHLVRLGAAWKVPPPILLFEYGLVVVAVAWMAIDRIPKAINRRRL